MNIEFTNPLVWGVPVFIAMVLLELTYSKTHDNNDLYSWKDLFASSSMGAGAVLIKGGHREGDAADLLAALDGSGALVFNYLLPCV